MADTEEMYWAVTEFGASAGIEVTASPTPLAWFLPGPIRMRGGAARHFASARHFHLGSHLGFAGSHHT